MHWLYYYFNKNIKSIKNKYGYLDKKHRRYLYFILLLFCSILGINYIPRNINWKIFKPSIIQPLLLDYPIRII